MTALNRSIAFRSVLTYWKSLKRSKSLLIIIFKNVKECFRAKKRTALILKKTLQNAMERFRTVKERLGTQGGTLGTMTVTAQNRYLHCKRNIPRMFHLSLLDSLTMTSGAKCFMKPSSRNKKIKLLPILNDSCPEGLVVRPIYKCE